ncbi:hypothetical protein TIFTF001_020591 [Ficus carica]|uniref:Uncharacterized protein n=1 Tax=Ficus carica TaxID=3494 RepID=A0AA88AY52_FICCA|nr:hypothetical protein TIFTF001_020591 [Ficus carica]
MREDAWAHVNDNRQKKREKTTCTWVQGRQSSEDEGEDNVHLGARTAIIKREKGKDNGHLGLERKGAWAL